MEIKIVTSSKKASVEFRVPAANVSQRRVVSTDEMLKFINDNMSVVSSSGLLPPSVRWVSRTGKHVIFERPPHEYTINYYGRTVASLKENADTVRQEYRLAMPWTVYGVSFNERTVPYNMYVFASPYSIRGSDTSLALLPLTNCELSGKFCMPPPVRPDKPLSLAEGINLAYRIIWDSNFNADIVDIPTYMYTYRTPPLLFKNIPNNGKVKPSNIYNQWSKHISLEDVKANYNKLFTPIQQVAHLIRTLETNEAQTPNSLNMMHSFRRILH